jgi:hypothetical protein
MKKIDILWKSFLQKNRIKHVLLLTPVEQSFLHQLKMKKLIARMQVVDTSWNPREVIWLEAIYNNQTLKFYRNYTDILNKEGLYLYNKEYEYYRDISDTFPELKEKEHIINEFFSDFILSLNLHFKK